MSLFIQRDVGTVGSGGVFPDRAGGDLLLVANGDSNYGETDLPAPSNLTQVTYAGAAPADVCPARLFALVNTDFGVNPSNNVDILVLAVDDTFALSDGTIVAQFAGMALPVGNSNNPTGSILAIYDTSNLGGTGICVKREGGDMDLDFPAPVILYHELSHAFRFAMGTTLDQTEDDCEDASDEEEAAGIDENDMRDQLAGGSGAHREANNHCGNTGCSTSCCIVASITTGSPFSPEVSSLRRLRDGLLRTSEVGHAFFDGLHFDYYTFSPEVCRLMANSKDVKELVERYFVRPLVLGLRTIHSYTVEGTSPEALGATFQRELEGFAAAHGMPSRDEVNAALVLLECLQYGIPGGEGPLGSLCDLLQSKALTSDRIRWALVEPVQMTVEALMHHLDGATADDIGRLLAGRIDEWGPRMPDVEVWSALSGLEIAGELRFLEKALLRSAAARQTFAARMLERHPGHARIERGLVDAGYIPARRGES